MLTPSHVYQEAGSYTATLTVSDSLGRSSQSSAAVTVTEVTPTANAGGPYHVGDDLRVQLDASTSSDPTQASTALIYQWDLDGDHVFGEVGAGASQGVRQPVLSHRRP